MGFYKYGSTRASWIWGNTAVDLAEPPIYNFTRWIIDGSMKGERAVFNDQTQSWDAVNRYVTGSCLAGVFGGSCYFVVTAVQNGDITFEDRGWKARVKPYT
jgi:hypothetical protein